MAPGRVRQPAPTRWRFVGRREELEVLEAALDDPACHGLLIFGAAGVGKTRLGEEGISSAARAGRAVARATASVELAAVPLGALMHVLPADLAGGGVDPGSLAERAIGSVRERAGQSALVLLVDDLHLLDITSVALLSQLIDAGAVFLIGTARSGMALPDVVSGWWRSERMVRIDLADLSREGVDTVLHLGLGGPVAAEVIAAAWSASRGNLLFLRELVVGAQAAGSLVDDLGVWRLAGPMGSTPRLAELVRARIGAVDSAAAPALNLLALASPVGLTELEALVPPDLLESLEAAGLIDVHADQRRQQVRLAHPLYGEVLRDGLPSLTRRRLLAQHADRIAGHGARRRDDPLRIANWRLDATGIADPYLLVTAAKLARYGYDLPQVERLARAALAQRPSAPAQLLLGEALHELGSFEEAEELLAAAEAAAPDDAELVQIVTLRVRNLSWGMLHADQALAVARAARSRIADSAAREELLAEEALTLTFAGQPAAALDLLNEHLAKPITVRTSALRAIPEASALTLVGRSDTAIAVAQQGFADHSQLGEQLAIAHPGVHFVNQVFALTEAGRLEEATELATAGYQFTVKDRAPAGRIWFTNSLGRLALFAGRPRSAQRWLAEALALTRDYRQDGYRRMVLTGAVEAAAILGDVGAATAALAELDRLPYVGLLAMDTELARAAALAAAGELQAAREVLLTAAAFAASIGALTNEARLLHEVVRLGAADAVHGRLTELAAGCEGAFVPAYAAHAEAAAASAAEGLAEAADRFAAIGAMLLAAEAATAAVAAFQRSGNSRRAAAMRLRAGTLAQLCEGATTRGLQLANATVPLTRREREVALLAGRGVSSRDIATRLFLSVRTVENHLQNAYAKLGVTSRDQLPMALGEVPE